MTYVPTGEPHGRPTKYTEELAEEILDRIAAGETVKAICEDLKVRMGDAAPVPTTVIGWAMDDKPEGFFAAYKRARRLAVETKTETMEEDVLEAAKIDPAVAQALFKARSWTCAMHSPDTHGTRTNLGGKLQVAGVDEAIRAAAGAAGVPL